MAASTPQEGSCTLFNGAGWMQASVKSLRDSLRGAVVPLSSPREGLPPCEAQEHSGDRAEHPDPHAGGELRHAVEKRRRSRPLDKHLPGTREAAFPFDYR